MLLSHANTIFFFPGFRPSWELCNSQLKCGVWTDAVWPSMGLLPCQESLLQNIYDTVRIPFCLDFPAGLLSSLAFVLLWSFLILCLQKEEKDNTHEWNVRREKGQCSLSIALSLHQLQLFTLFSDIFYWAYAHSRVPAWYVYCTWNMQKMEFTAISHLRGSLYVQEHKVDVRLEMEPAICGVACT